LLLTLLGVSGGAAGPQCADQSPRYINPKANPSPYNATSNTSIVSTKNPRDPMNPLFKQVYYQPRGSSIGQILSWCGAHYHMPVENVQGCPGETEVLGSLGDGEPIGGLPWKAGKVPPPGQWVEIHVVYAAKVQSPCPDPEGLSCCLAGPIVVTGMSAKVRPAYGGNPELGVPADPFHAPEGLAQWSGSSTGAESQPGACKATAAQWSFRLGCDFGVDQIVLARNAPKGAQPARPLQGGGRLSRDLTLMKR
jgi:hypothetical protein